MRREIQEQSGLSPQKIGFAKGWLTNQPTGEQPFSLFIFHQICNTKSQFTATFVQRDPQIKHQKNTFLYDKAPQKKKNENQQSKKGKTSTFHIYTGVNSLQGTHEKGRAQIRPILPLGTF